jgi:hypothetical protein
MSKEFRILVYAYDKEARAWASALNIKLNIFVVCV